jgi:polyisoprenyl-phosphate glycosyltransferase
MGKKKYDLVIVVPVYNDEESFNHLFADILKYKRQSNEKIYLIAVDDGSIQGINFRESQDLTVEVLTLVKNVGHQKAIAIGLSYASQEIEADYLLVMDSDGEDQPKDIARLVSAAKENPAVVFASRTKRTEGLLFRVLYACYKLLFSILTGTRISFGNFCIMPFPFAQKLTYMSEIWIHFSGGIIKSKLPYTLVPTEKGKRYAGKSKMNFQSLILHGLSSLSVHIETIAVRFLIASVILLLLSVFFIFVVIGIKLLTALALPGWTSSMLIGLTLIFLQALLFSILLTFIILSYRTQKSFIPAIDYKIFIQQSEVNK